MFGAIKDFFMNIIFNDTSETGAYALDDFNITWFGHTNVSVGEVLSYICTIVTILFIFVLCCLFVYKIIKLIGGLIR